LAKADSTFQGATLDIMLGRPPELDVATLQQKMIAIGQPTEPCF
jgi:hypothetical protein